MTADCQIGLFKVIRATFIVGLFELNNAMSCCTLLPSVSTPLRVESTICWAVLEIVLFLMSLILPSMSREVVITCK